MGNLRKIRKAVKSLGPASAKGQGQGRVERIDLDRSELEAILAHAKTALSEEEYTKLHAAMETLIFLTAELEKNRVSVQRLKQLLFGATTETTRKVIEKILDDTGKAKQSAGSVAAEGQQVSPPEQAQGHGRNGAQAYVGAQTVRVPHESLKPGDPCPNCKKGTVYQTAEPARLVRIRGQAPLGATVYELQRLRCNLCGEVFTAQTPEGVGPDKYDAESASMIALYFTGHRHAGENLVALLKQRASQLGPPIQMCDALSRNMPDELKTIVANCLTHGRRRFVDVAADFPDECLHVLEVLKEVYRNDALAKSQGLSAQERLDLHKAQSGPKMDELKAWMAAQITDKRVEPNSGLGEAIAYMDKHWNELTLFLRQAAAPLDNKVCEQALKKAILHRKNAYFYKTANGARVGDLFMSLIQTCELNGVNPFDYLTALNQHAKELSACPAEWMPWNYQDAVKRQAATGRSR